MDNRLESARLKQLIAQRCEVKVYLRNSYLMIGKIKAQDDRVIEIEVDGEVKLVYKDFISTIEKCK